jgi:molybdenum cofactor guanylyltransferase
VTAAGSRNPPSVTPLAAEGVEGFVLAGGRSIRMGTDKALIQLSGRRLIEIALDKLRTPLLSLSRAPRVAGSRPDLAAYAPVIGDIHPGCGPLSGIEAALAASACPFNLFLPVDLPLLPAKFLEWMLHRASITGAWVTFPRVNGRPQPLCAIYHRGLSAHISRSMGAGDYKVVTAVTAAALQDCSPPGQCLDTFDIESIAAAYPELHSFSPVPLHRWFQNLNWPEDLAAIRAEENAPRPPARR